MTCGDGRERATGIEPAFSAWEAHRRGFRHLQKRGKDQLNPISTYLLLFAVTHCCAFLVARNRSNSVNGTLWHGAACHSQPCKLRTESELFPVW